MWVQSAYAVVVTIASIDVLFWDRRWNVATNNINRYSSNYPRFMYYFVFLWSSSHFMVWAFSAVNASNIDGHSFQFAWCFLLVGVRGSSQACSQNVTCPEIWGHALVYPPYTFSKFDRGKASIMSEPKKVRNCRTIKDSPIVKLVMSWKLLNLPYLETSVHWVKFLVAL